MSEDRLPDSWDDVDAERPTNMRQGVTPRRLQDAVDAHNTLYDVTRSVRTSRSKARSALSRLDLLDGLDQPDARGDGGRRIRGDL